MNARQVFHADACEVVMIRLDVGPDDACASAALLSDADRERAGRFAFNRDRRRFTVARAGLRRLLSARLGVEPDAVELTTRTHGKPALAGVFADSDLRFNVSHSGDVAVYAFARGREVGVDIEAIRPVLNADRIAGRFFSRGENEAIAALDPRDRSVGFFNCWTRKEAFVKAVGDGLQHPLGRFDVSLDPADRARLLRVDNVPGDRCGWTLHGFVPGPGLVGACVVRTDAPGRSTSMTMSHRTALAASRQVTETIK